MLSRCQACLISLQHEVFVKPRPSAGVATERIATPGFIPCSDLHSLCMLPLQLPLLRLNASLIKRRTVGGLCCVGRAAALLLGDALERVTVMCAGVCVCVCLGGVVGGWQPLLCQQRGGTPARQHPVAVVKGAGRNGAR